MAADTANHENMIQIGLVAYLISKLTSPSLQVEAAQALEHMCTSVEGLDSVVTEGGIPPLVKLLRSG